jgi:F-type H+-transporting ATPase subunit a
MNKNFELEEYIMNHMQDAREWHLPFLPPMHLPPFLSLHGVMLIVCSLLLIALFCKIYNKNQRVPTGITNLLEVLILFVRDQISIKHLGEDDGRKMAPLFCTYFFFILGLNLMGMIPLFVTATANINITAALAATTLFFMIFGAMYKNGWKGFWGALSPSGVPLPILFILVPIELVSLFIKSFALMIRLFANMLAGHIVIFALLGLGVLLGFTAVIPALLLALFIGLLEIFVAFLQAYIFTLLSAAFIGQMYKPEH